jgi:hypothetical protein
MKKAPASEPNWVKIDGMRPAYAMDGNAIWTPTTHATDVTRQTHLHLVCETHLHLVCGV